MSERIAQPDIETKTAGETSELPLSTRLLAATAFAVLLGGIAALFAKFGDVILSVAGHVGPVGYFAAVGFVSALVGIRAKKATPEEVKIAQEISQKADELKAERDSDFFAILVQLNFKYLDKYYLQTQEQANRSFRLAATASIVGLGVISFGTVLMFQGATLPAYLTTGAGAFTELVAATFFYLYNKTILSMGGYHQKLVITQNIALALKITGDMPEQERGRAQVVLIEALTKDVNRHLSSGIPGLDEKPRKMRPKKAKRPEEAS